MQIAVLSDQQKAKASEWILAKIGPVPICPVCRGGQFELAPHLGELGTYNGGSPIGERSIYPLLILTCTTCGNMRFFNAIHAGIVTKEQLEKLLASPSAQGAVR